MGILSRIAMMTKAVTNDVLDKIENPTVMMNQYLRDLDEQIASTEQAVIEKQAQQRILQGKLADLDGHISYYEGKAEQAAMEAREVDARTAIEAKLLYQEQRAETFRLQQLADQAIVELQQRVEALKEERQQLQNKRTELVTRMQKAGANANQGYPWGSHLQGSSATQGFNRIEQKILEWEAQQEISRKYNPYASAASPEAEQQTTRNSHVEEELQRLMQKQQTVSNS